MEIANRIETGITDGTYPIGTALPREVDMSSEWGVSRNTVRAALAKLSDAGMVRRIKRKGTIVQNRLAVRPHRLEMSAIEGLRQYVRSTRLTLLSRGSARSPQSLSAFIPIPADRLWQVMRGVRHAADGGPPVATIKFFVDARFADAAAQYGNTDGLLYEVIESMHGVRAARFDILIRAARLSAGEAKLLACPVSTPAVQMIESVFTQEGELIEFGSLLVPQDRLRLSYSLQIPPPRV